MKKKVKSFFKKHPTLKIKSRELAKKIDAVETFEYAHLKDVLHNLTREGFLSKQGKRYLLCHESLGDLTGEFSLVRNRGFGFVVLKNTSMKDVYISDRNTGTAFDGDTVKVELFAKKSGKNPEGAIVEVIDRMHSQIIGTLKKNNSFFYVHPENPKIHRDIYVSKANLAGAELDQIVEIADIVWLDEMLNPEGKVSRVIGNPGDYDAQVYAIAKENNVEVDFPAEVLNEASNISGEIQQEEIHRRLDLRDEIIVTIDPDDAKDFDDAVSIRVLSNGNFEVGVHIADVSHYVREGTALYNEALNRGTSIYLVGRVIPMLPESLSNNICSLVPGEDRLTYSVMIEMNSQGKVFDYKIVKSVINSKRRFTYNEVQTILDNKNGEHFDKLNLLNKLARTLRKKRFSKGSINFHTPEVNFKLDDRGKPQSVEIKEIKESNQLIEEFMLLANQITAAHLKECKIEDYPFIFRVHDLPDEEKLSEFANFVKSLGYHFDKGGANRSMAFQKILNAVEGTAEEALINEIAIRSMAKAVYSVKNIGHYGLAFPCYTHFTSPIRRFPDLIIHQIIHKYADGAGKPENRRELEQIAEHCSAKERIAINVERTSVKLKQIEYLSNQIGDEFTAIISGITSFGIFVELCENLAEGLIRMRDLEDDYYIFDEKKYQLRGKSSSRVFRLGDKINVQLIRVDERKREIDFVLSGN